MTCAGVYRKVEDELSIYIQNKIPSYVPKNKLKLSICIWYLRIDIEHLNLLFLLKLHPATVERQLSYLKCFVTMPLWQSDNLGIILCHQSFLLHCLSLPCQKLLPLLESIFFPYDFKNTTHSITLINSHAVSRNTQIIFIALTFSWRRPISYRNQSIDLLFMISASFMKGLMVSPSAIWRAWPWQYVKWAKSRLCTLLVQS